MRDTKNTAGVILVAISGISFGLLPVFAKIAYASGTSTFTLLFLRFLTAAVFMFAMMFFKKIKIPPKKEIILYMMLGAFGYVGESLCYFMALKYASTGVAALLLYTHPAIVMAGSVIFFKEKITPQKLISLILALVGAFAIIGAEFDASLRGIILALMAALFYSAYILASSRIVRPGKGIESSAFIMLGASLVYGMLNIFAGFEPPHDIPGLAAVVMIALVSTALAFWGFFVGMEKVGPTTASFISTLEPVTSVLASLAILDEKITANVVIGGLLVLSSLFVTLLGGKEKNKKCT